MMVCLAGSVSLHHVSRDASKPDSTDQSNDITIRERYGPCDSLVLVGDIFGDREFVAPRTELAALEEQRQKQVVRRASVASVDGQTMVGASGSASAAADIALAAAAAAEAEAAQFLVDQEDRRRTHTAIARVRTHVLKLRYPQVQAYMREHALQQLLKGYQHVREVLSMVKAS